MFMHMPSAKTADVCTAYSVKPIDTIASLFGTTPCMSKAIWNRSPNGTIDCCTTPAPKTIKPRIVLIVPLMIARLSDFLRIKPSIAISPTKIAGVERICCR